jgi:hypothetical protein
MSFVQQDLEYLLKEVIEGKPEGNRRPGRRRKEIMNGLKETRER